MKRLAFEEVPGDRQGFGGDFPLGLGRQPGAGPAGEGVGLVVADVADRLARDQVAHAREGHRPPLAVVDFPVERGGPALRRRVFQPSESQNSGRS